MKLTFEGIDYASWQTAYSAQGITFTGGTLVQNLGNHYIVGSTTMLFNPELALDRITFRGDAAGPDNMLLTYTKGEFFEPVLFESGSWTPTGRIDGWTPGMMFDGRVLTAGLVDQIYFANTIALDDIELHSPPLASAAVPEPSTFLLILIAALTWSLRNVRIFKKA